MIKNISIEALRSFVTIAELGSFTQAGDKLARSQSAISLQVKKLLAEWMRYLLDRHEDVNVISDMKDEVIGLCLSFPVYR